MLNNPAKIGAFRCGGGEKLFVIAGPCVIENESLTLSIAERLAKVARDLPVQIVFKASFDKANRTSLDSYRGAGLEEGLRVKRRGCLSRPTFTNRTRRPWQPKCVRFCRFQRFCRDRPTC